MKKLTELMDKYGSDKGTVFGGGHSYSEYYNDIFIKYKTPKILEIGILNGADVSAISDFYNGECEIYGIDIDQNCRRFENTIKNFHFIMLDQSKRDELADFSNSGIAKEGFDIIIDDGSHNWFDQMLTLSYLNKCVKNNGIYILEDLHTSMPWFYDGRFGDRTKTKTTLDCILNRVPFELLTTEENAAWLSNMKDVQIITHKNKMNEIATTSIITF